MSLEILMPQLGMFMMSGTIVRWLVADGGAIKRGDGLVEIQTEKVIQTIESPSDGVVQHVAREGEQLKVRGLIGYVLAAGEQRLGRAAEVEGAAPREAGAAPAATRAPAGEVRASPFARKLAAENGIDLAIIVGTGPGGRIGERDVQAAIEAKAKQAAVAVEAPAPQPELEAPIAPLSGIQGAMFERMSQSHREVARVTEFTEVDATALVEVRTRLNAELERTQGVSVGYSELLTLLVARALREHRSLNSTFVDGTIRLQTEINVGLAVDSERGLLVPVVRRADTLSLADIVREVHTLVERAREGRSTLDDLSGGTFTITDLGIYEIDGFTPIVHLPECAALGMGRIAPKTVVRQGRVAIRPMMSLSLSFDHRLIDGAAAAQFLRSVKSLIENPSLLALAGGE